MTSPDRFSSNMDGNLAIGPEIHPAIIDFHHKKDKKKEMAISFMVANGYSIAKIKEELSKCQVVCANCHRKIHYNNKL